MNTCCGSRRSRFIVLEVSSPRQVSQGPNQGVSLAAPSGEHVADLGSFWVSGASPHGTSDPDPPPPSCKDPCGHIGPTGALQAHCLLESSVSMSVNPWAPWVTDVFSGSEG